MSFFDDVESGFEEIGNAVTGAATTVGNDIANTAESFGDSAWNYAIIVGDGVASAGQVVGDGVVTFGTSVERFSVSAGGTAFNWLKTSAYDVESWTVDAAGIVADFTVSAYNQARDGVLAAWKFLKDLLSSSLPELDDPSAMARQMASFILSGAALGYEQMAKRAGMTISFNITPKAGALFNISYTLGLYVDDHGDWGFLKLTGWDQFKNLSTASLSLDAGISVTIDNVFVFGSRQRYSKQRYFDLGAKANFEGFSVGGAVMLEEGDFSFLGFKLSASIGLDLMPAEGPDHTQPPSTTFSLTGGQSLNVSALVSAVGSSGATYDAAVRTAIDPGCASSLLAAALASTLTPFAPRFYGYLQSPIYDGQLIAFGSSLIFASGAAVKQCFRFVAGLADPQGVSIELLYDNAPPAYVCIVSDGVQLQGYIEAADYKATATFNLEQGLGDKSGVSLSTRTTPKRYLTVSDTRSSAWGMTIQACQLLPFDPSATFAQRATFKLAAQPMAANQTAVLRPGDILRVGDYRRSPDGRYFMTLDSHGVLGLQCGSGPKDIRPPLAYAGAPGTGVLPGGTRPAGLNDATLGLTVMPGPGGVPRLFRGSNPADPAAVVTDIPPLGTPGDMFLGVTDGGRIALFQGYPDAVGELLSSSNLGIVSWAKSRTSVAIKGPDGRYVQNVGDVVNGMGYLRWDSSKFSSNETFELAALFDGKSAFRSFSGWYVSSRWEPVAHSTTLDQTALTVDIDSANLSGVFQIESRPNGKIAIRCQMGGKLWRADPSGQVTAIGEDSDPLTLFTMVPLDRNLSAEVGRSFSITNKHSGRRLTVTDGSQAPATAITQLGETGGRNQAFTLVQAAPGVYSFAAQHSGQLFDIYGGSTSPGTAVIQYPSNGGANQQFRLLPNDDGTYCIIAQHSGLALDVAGAATGDGAAIIQAAPNGSDSQRFYIKPEQPLVTRALVASPAGSGPMRVRYQERIGQSAWLDGWLDSMDRRLTGDFLGIHRTQLLCINRSGVGGRVMLADFGGSSETGRALYYEPNGESAWLNGWLDDSDWQMAGDFMRRGRSQLLIVNRGGTGGRVALLELSPQGYKQLYCELWGQSPLFNGWMDDNDRWLTGDFMGAGCDQVLCLNRTPGGGKVMVVDFSTGTTTVPYWENWGANPWLNGWLDDPVRHYIGDFMGLGHAQWLMIDPRNTHFQVGDLSTGQPRVLASGSGAPLLSGWIDSGDVQLVGDFVGLGRSQLLFVNRQPHSDGKLMIVQVLASGQLQACFLEMWGQRTCFDGLLEPADLLLAGDFMGDGRKLAQVMVLSPNVKGSADPKLIPASGPSAASLGLDILAHFTSGGDLHFPPEAAAYNAGSAIEGFTLQLSPPIPGLSLEYMASVSTVGSTGWVPAGTYCGTTGRGLPIESLAIRLTGDNKAQYTVRYAANGQPAADGVTCGTPGSHVPIVALRASVAKL